MNKEIATLLAAGYTPEKIYQDALEAVKEQQENKKVAEARNEFLNAMRKYVTSMTNEPISDEDMAALTKDFFNVEKLVADMKASEKKAGCKKNTCKKKSDEQALAEFLEFLGLV